MTARWRFNGWRSSTRRKAMEDGGMFLVTPSGALLRGRPYKLKPSVYLCQITEPFEVEMEGGGVLIGVAGEYLMVGPRGELSVVRRSDLELYDEVADIAYVP